MLAQTSWASEALAINHAASFETEEAMSARVAPDSEGLFRDHLPRIIGTSGALRNVLELVRAVAPTDSTVLLNGETGTGKELIAKAIHESSHRSRGPFVKVNCAAIPAGLLESELFGHERGAYTGAVTRGIGRFERANRGTLFLDEIGDLPLELQPKLLRVMQEKEFERLGGTDTIRSDVRVICATHRNLGEMMNRREFRADLYYRLGVFPIELPPLREHREDIADLVTHFVAIFGRRVSKQIEEIPPETMAALQSYQWPGNVRELQNLIERAVILSNRGVLPNPLPPEKAQDKSLASPAVDSSAIATRSLKEFQRALILRTLEAVGWVIGGPKGAAAKLGLARTTLIHRMQQLGIARPGLNLLPSQGR